MRRIFVAFTALTALAVVACTEQSAADLAASAASAEASNAGADAAKNLTDGRAFLAQNAKVAGVTTLPSGVQFRVVRKGPGGAKPTMQDEVKIHYEGKLIDGTVFDSSYERGQPATFPLGGVIPGWAEAVMQMSPGDEFQVFIPPEQGYGSQSKGELPANSVLIFRIELLDVLSGPQFG